MNFTESNRFNFLQYKYRFIVYFFLSQLILIFCLFGFVYVFKYNLPSPRLSNSVSFNEKARWLHKQNLNSNKCDILVAGSSMALNNIDWSYIQSKLDNKNIVNTSSWGSLIPDGVNILNTLVPMCKPDLIVYIIFYGDFNSKENKTIDWSLYKEYISSRNDEEFYFKAPDLMYYLTNFFRNSKKNAEKNKIYESLIFYKTGTVNLDCTNFQVEEGRWNGYLKMQDLNKDGINIALENLSKIEEIARENASKLIVVLPPLRNVAINKINKISIDGMWDKAASSVESSGGIFLNYMVTSGFSDEYFVDFAHLNQCGANKMSKLILPSILDQFSKSQ